MSEFDRYLEPPSMTVPAEGVPDYLAPSLRKWIDAFLDRLAAVTDASLFAEGVALRLQLKPLKDAYNRPSHTRALLSVSDERLFHVVNTMFRLISNTFDVDGSATELGFLLRMSGSAYEVEKDDNGWHVVRRIDSSMKSAATEAINQAGQASGDLLRSAWLSTFGLEPDADAAYAQAVKAVEAVAIPLMVPNATNPTLGTVLSALRGAAAANSPKWELVIPDQNGAPRSVEVVLTMVETLWHGQRSRHAGSPNARPNTQHESEAAVFLAITLVYWFSKGVIIARP